MFLAHLQELDKSLKTDPKMFFNAWYYNTLFTTNTKKQTTRLF